MPHQRHPQPKYPAHQLLQHHPNHSARQLAQIFNVDHHTIQRWRNQHTTINQWDADRHAIKLGKHPSEIWTNWFDIPC